jgi:two-component system nitrate/nitrite response regulator NarL
MKQSAQSFVARAQQKARPIHLTRRELEVLALLCEGLPNKLISRRLNISAATVKCHISRILSELGVTSRLQAVVAASRYGLIADSVDAPQEAAASTAAEPDLPARARPASSLLIAAMA